MSAFLAAPLRFAAQAAATSQLGSRYETFAQQLTTGRATPFFNEQGQKVLSEASSAHGRGSVAKTSVSLHRQMRDTVPIRSYLSRAADHPASVSSGSTDPDQDGRSPAATGAWRLSQVMWT